MLVERRFLNTRENPLISWFISNEPEFSKLNVSDRTEFFHLLNLFTFSEDRNKRNLGISTFIKHLQLIHNYICKGDMYDSLRGLICGIEFGNNSFIINTGKLKKLMCRSKSCMNGCFQKIGYTVCKPSQDISSLFSQFLPNGSHILSARQWCVRKSTHMTSIFFSPNIKIEIATNLPASRPPNDNKLKGKKWVIKDIETTSDGRSSPPEFFEKEIPNPLFLFDIQYLLNHQETDSSCIHRM